MKKTLITFLLLMVVVISTKIEASELRTQGMTYTEAQNLDVSRLNCHIDFEYTIGELARWVDIIDNRDQLIKDLAIINQVISIVEKAKGTISVIHSSMLLQIQSKVSKSLQSVFIQNKWAACKVEDALEYVAQLNGTQTIEEKIALANKIIAQLRQTQDQIHQYLDQCSYAKRTQGLRQKISQLQTLKRVCDQEIKKPTIIIDNDPDDEVLNFDEEPEEIIYYYFEEEDVETPSDYVYHEPQHYTYPTYQDETKKPQKKQVKKLVPKEIVDEIKGNKRYVALGHEIEGEMKDNVDEQQNQQEEAEFVVSAAKVSKIEGLNNEDDDSEKTDNDKDKGQGEEEQKEQTNGEETRENNESEQEQIIVETHDKPLTQDESENKENVTIDESKNVTVDETNTGNADGDDTSTDVKITTVHQAEQTENESDETKETDSKEQESTEESTEEQTQRETTQQSQVTETTHESESTTQSETKVESTSDEKVEQESTEHSDSQQTENEADVVVDNQSKHQDDEHVIQIGSSRVEHKKDIQKQEVSEVKQEVSEVKQEESEVKQEEGEVKQEETEQKQEEQEETEQKEEGEKKDEGHTHEQSEDHKDSHKNQDDDKKIKKQKTSDDRSLKIQSLREEPNPNEPTQFQPPKHRANSGRVQERKVVAVNTKYQNSDFDGEPTEQFEFTDRSLLQDSSEYGYGYWVRYTEHGVKEHSREDGEYYFLSRMTINEQYEDFSFYGDRALAVFLFDNSFVFSTYDTSEKLKTKDKAVVLNENMDSMWYFVMFSYSNPLRRAVGYIASYGEGNGIYRVELEATHIPPSYIKIIFGGKHLDYSGLNGQFANIFFDIDAPAFVDGDEALNEVLSTLSNPPQSVPAMIDDTVVQKPKHLNGNDKGEQYHFDPQESQLIIEEYAVGLWFRWIDDLKVDEPNTFQLINLRSNKVKTAGKGVLGDRALEVHYTYGGGAKSSVYFNTYTIKGNRAKGQPYLSKTVESVEFIWTYVYFGYDNDGGRAYGAVIKPGLVGEIKFEGIQHKLVNSLSVTLGGDDVISPFNGMIGYVGIYLGTGAYREGLEFEMTFNYGEGVMGVYQVGKPITYIAGDANQARDVAYDAPENVVDKIIIHNEEGMKINGQSEYGFGLWTRWLSTLPKYLNKRAPIHTIARMGTQGYVIESIDGKLVRSNANRPSTPKDTTLSISLTPDSYEFQTLELKDDIEFSSLEGHWNYVYFGYIRHGDQGLAKGYVQFGVDGEVEEVIFDTFHDYLLEYVEFIVGKTSAPLFNGEMARISFSFGPGSFISTMDTLRIFTQNTLPEKAQIHPVARQTLQLVGAPQQLKEEPIQFEFDKYQGAEEYAISGWVRWSGPLVTGKVSHLITMAQKRLEDLDDKNEETLQIIRGDQAFTFITYNQNQGDYKLATQDEAYGEYADQWTYIYYGFSQQKQQTYGYLKFTFTESEFRQEKVNHFYLAVFSVLIQEKQQYTQFIGQIKTWVINIGDGAFREGGFDENENIKVHFGFISGTDHIKLQQAGQEAHHEETILECSSQSDEVPLHIEFEQSDKLHLHGVSEYGYGYWVKFQYFASKNTIYSRPQLMGLSRLTSNKDYKDFDHPGDRVLLVLLGKQSYHFGTYDVITKSNNVAGDIPYQVDSESEWTYIYFSFKRISQTQGHAMAFTHYKDTTSGIQMDVMHSLLNDYLQLTVGNAGKYYSNFNGQITTIRFNLGPGAYIDNKQGLLQRIKNKDVMPDILAPTKKYEVLIGKHDVTKIEEDQHITHISEEAREYGIQLWFRWFKLPVKTQQLIYRFTSSNPDSLGDAQKIGDRTLALFHTDGIEFSTYNLNPLSLQDTYEAKIPSQQLEVWTFVYFGYSKHHQKVSYYLLADDDEHKGLEQALHVVSNNYWLFLVKDAMTKPFDSRLAQVILNIGDGSYREDNFNTLQVYLAAPKLFSTDSKFDWEADDTITLVSGDPEKQGLKITFSEPDRKIESVQEYSVGLWTRFLQAWPERQWHTPSEMQIVRLTYNDEVDHGKIAIGDRILNAMVVLDNYQFGTYDLNDDAPNEISTIPYTHLEGRWHYIYLGYKRQLQQANYFVFDGDEIKHASNEKLLHKPLGDYIHLILGGEKDVAPFQGLFTEVAAHFGVGSFISSGEDLMKSIDTSFALPQELTVDYIHKQKHGQQQLIGESDNNEGSESTGDTWSGVGEYAISGWFKIAETQVKKEGEINSPCQILFRITNNDKEHLSDRKSQGDRALHAQICTSDTVKLSTYTLKGLKDWNEAKFLEEKVELGNSKKAWAYLYMAYNENVGEVHTLLHLFEEDKPVIFKGVQHFVPHFIGIYVGKDPHSRRFQGELQKWVAQYGQGAFVDVMKKGYEDTLPNFRHIQINQKYLWFEKEDRIIQTPEKVEQTFTSETESVDEYAVGVWTRWLIAFPTTLTDRADVHTIFRFSSTRQYQDKSELGNRVLSAFLTKGNYEFSTYDASKPAIAVDAQLPYESIEGEWTYVYAAYKNKNFYGMVLFKDQQKAVHLNMEVTHQVLTGYAHFVLGANEFGYKAFHGWFYDPRIFLGAGSYISESQKVVEMIHKLHRKLPVTPQQAEDFKWPVSLLDTTNQDDLDSKKDKLNFEFTDKAEMQSYSIGFWYQNAMLLPEMENDFTSLVRLTTNGPDLAADDKFIGDRTLAFFTKSDKLMASTYTIKDPSFEPLSHTFDIKEHQWTFVYFGYEIHHARAYVLSPKGPTEKIFIAQHIVPNAFYLRIVNDLGHPSFWGKIYGLKVNFGEGSYLENPLELIDKWPYDPKQHSDIDKQGDKVLSINSAKVTKQKSDDANE
ncbi:unnamed protein product [Paramecium octaurelia]|uniref:Uncharacterized protein n=1 Tax=Paramecium octaurelia TaxID=43137 RepID=A0A8S1SRP0_PAROT|nr:unnamed protein product [Paramecium octaurelia]